MADITGISNLSSSSSGATSLTGIQSAATNLNSDKAESSTVSAHTGASTNVHGLSGGASVVGDTQSQTLSNKTLTTPTIGSFANANHDHSNSAGGGQITDTALSAAVTVPKGGTGKTSVTAYAVLAGGTTGTAAFQSVASVGTSGQLLTSNGAGALPTFQAATNPAVYKNGTTTRSMTAASGTQTIAHGLGTTPKKIKITTMVWQTTTNSQFSFGAYNGTTNSNVNMDNAAGGSVGNDDIYIAYLSQNAAGLQTASAAFDATNITLTWTKTSTPAGTVVILWEAE